MLIGVGDHPWRVFTAMTDRATVLAITAVVIGTAMSRRRLTARGSIELAAMVIAAMVVHHGLLLTSPIERYERTWWVEFVSGPGVELALGAVAAAAAAGIARRSAARDGRAQNPSVTAAPDRDPVLFAVLAADDAARARSGGHRDRAVGAAGRAGDPDGGVMTVLDPTPRRGADVSAATDAVIDALVDLPLAPADATYNLPPDDTEMWSYTEGLGGLFLVFSALSKMCLGIALGFLSLQGQWLLMLLPFAVMVVLGSIISLVWATQVRPFDRTAHDRAVRRGPRSPGSVDVFITTCGEDAFVIEHTLWRAMMLDHPDVRVYVLDDKGSDEIRRYAEIWGATYFHRPNRGWMKKAGNLHHAYQRSDGDYIVVLDADFAVRPDFLAHTLPYFDDPTIGILQTPQFFRVSRTNWVERGAAAQQEQFYRIGMRARDRRGGAICVGTNAVYRRSALDERGGMAGTPACRHRIRRRRSAPGMSRPRSAASSWCSW